MCIRDRPKHKPIISPSLQAQIIANNQFDIALYDHAVKVFQEQKEPPS